MKQQYETVCGKIPTEWEGLSLKDVHNGKNKMINPQAFPSETFELYSIPAYYAKHTPELKIGKFIQSTKFLVEQDTILFGKINPRNPKVWKVNSNHGYRKIASTEFIPISPNKDTSLDFIYQILSSDTLIEKSKTLISGTTPSRARIEPRRFYDLIIPHPPLKEQQKIASILSNIDEFLQRIDRIIEKTQLIKKGLVQRLLTKGIGHSEFKKVKTIFGKYEEIPEDWEIVNLGQMIKDIRYGTSIKCSSIPKGIPVLRIPNIVQGVVTFNDLKYAELSHDDTMRFGLKDGDILFVRTNGNRDYVGRCAAFHKTNGDYGFASYLIRVKLNVERLTPDFFTLQVSSPAMRKQILNQTKTSAGQYNINTQGINSLEIILPPLTIQNNITSIISDIENQMGLHRIQKSEIENIKKGLMQQLLTGKIRVKI